MSAETTAEPSKAEAIQHFIVHHIIDNEKEWHLPFGIHIPLPEWITLHGLMAVIAAVILIVLFCVIYKKDQKVPSGMTNLLETFIIFIRDDIVYPNMGKEDGRRMLPVFLTFFFFILTMNLMGMIPLFSTATANFSVTTALCGLTFLFIVGGGIVKSGVGGFFKAFVPHGVPWPVLVLITPLEMLGVVIKCFALTIRLFANMLAGHIVIMALCSLVVSMGLVALPAIAIAGCIGLLELFVAFLQAYIFTLLSAMFIGMVWHPDH